MTREHPTLLAGPLVNMTIAGRKTETRRPITRSNSHRVDFWNSKIDGDGDGQGGPGGCGGFDDLDWDAHVIEFRGLPGSMTPHVGGQPCTDRCEGRDYCSILVDGNANGPGGFGCGEYLHVPGFGGETRQRVYPRVDPGDILWIREAFSVLPSSLDLSSPTVRVRYTSDGSTRCISSEKARAWLESDPKRARNWPSIHMPKWACRLRLRVHSVHAEKVQWITDAGARAEGVYAPGRERAAFGDLWDKIYNNWQADPWVWVYKFGIDEVLG